MKERQPPASRDDFQDVADAAAAWREQQIAALTERPRQLYEQASRKSKEREDAKARELEKRIRTDIQERMRKKILSTPQFELVPGGKRTKITGDLARRLISEYFQPGWRHDLSPSHTAVQEAAKAASREIQQEHARERQTFSDKERAKLDNLLRRFERAREMKGQTRQEFTRAGVKEKAKTAFTERAQDLREPRDQQQARDQAERPSQTDTAERRAWERIRTAMKRREHEKNRGKDRDDGRER